MHKYDNKLVVIEDWKVVFNSKKKQFKHLFKPTYIWLKK